MDVYEGGVRARRRSLIKSGAASETPQNSPREKLARLHKEQDSLLSTASGFDNYRGLLHLGGILLVLSTFRVALDNLIKYGVLASPITWFEAFIGDPSRWPCTLLIFTLNGYIIAALLLEKAIIKRLLSNMTACLLYVMILASVLIVPTSAVLILAPNPFASAVALSLHTITFLKLFSYMVVNNSFRQNSREKQLIIKEGHEKEGNKDDQHMIYPENVNIKDIYYFMYAPTLCYELNFPRNARIRKRYLLKRLTEVVVLSSILLALGQQWLVPTIQNSMQPFKELEYSRFAERVLKLAIPNLLLWLIFFYGFFHSFLNMLGEALRFADRGFYNAWWNAETIPQFWADWNIPAHKWARQHVFKPMLRAGYSKLQAAVVVFIISAFFHEFLVSVPLRMLRAWAFVAMLSQVPLAYMTSRFLRGYLGNIVVWLTIILGQPLAVLMYFHDYYILHSSTQ